MKKIKSKQSSWFFIVLLITVIAYLSINPKSFSEGFNEGIDISGNLDISRNSNSDISKNTYTYDTYDDTYKEKEKDKKTDSPYTPYIELEQIAKKWIDFQTYSAADFAFITVLIILFFIILFLLTKL